MYWGGIHRFQVNRRSCFKVIDANLGVLRIGCSIWFWGPWGGTLSVELELFIAVCIVYSSLGFGLSAFELERAFKLRVLLDWFWGCRELLVLAWGFMWVFWGFWYILFSFMSRISWQTCCILVIRCCVHDTYAPIMSITIPMITHNHPLYVSPLSPTHMVRGG